MSTFKVDYISQRRHTEDSLVELGWDTGEIISVTVTGARAGAVTVTCSFHASKILPGRTIGLEAGKGHEE